MNQRILKAMVFTSKGFYTEDEAHRQRCVFCGVGRSRPISDHAIWCPGKVFREELKAMAESGNHPCICPRECDCDNPEPEGDEMAICSKHCPVHNIIPAPDPDCPAFVHFENCEHCNPVRDR